MASVAFKGFVGKVHGLKFNNDGKPRFSFSVAEGHRRLNKQTNEWEDMGTTWWAVTVFGRDAEALADVIAEGKKQLVTVAGRSSTREYEANGEKRTSLDVVADYVGIVHRLPQGSPATHPGTYQSQQSAGFAQPQQTSGQQVSTAGTWTAPQPPAQDPWGGQPSGDWGTPSQQSEVPF